MLQFRYSIYMLYHMKKTRLTQIEKEIDGIKGKLQFIGEMRPGALTEQYKDPKKKEGGYFQLSYTYKMKSRTEYIRPVFEKVVRKQVKDYKRFKKLVEKWIDLSIEHSRLKMEKDIHDIKKIKRGK